MRLLNGHNLPSRGAVLIGHALLGGGMNPKALFANGLDGAVLDVARHDGDWQPDWPFRAGLDGALFNIAEHGVPA